MNLFRKKIVKTTKSNSFTYDKPQWKKNYINLEDFINQRDYTGAMAYLEFCRENGKNVKDLELWIAFAAFHAGLYQYAADEYEKLLEKLPESNQIYNYLACCYFTLGKYVNAEQIALKGEKSPLQTRILYCIAHMMNDMRKTETLSRQLQNSTEDRMCQASMYCIHNEYNKAIEIYKEILTENRDYLAINVYIAICFYKLNFFDLSQDFVEIYLQKYPNSIISANLKASCLYQIYDDQKDFNSVIEHASTTLTFGKEILQHNMAIFQKRNDRFNVFKQTSDVIPEARLNLIIYHLKQDEFELAFDKIKDLEDKTSIEFILKGIANVIHGQENDSYEHIKRAEYYFQSIHALPNDHDTISGRQAIASYYFLKEKFSEALIYLNSINVYLLDDDTFNFNYGQAKAKERHWDDAEKAFIRIRSEKIKTDNIYLTWLARCYIYNNKANLAWDLYCKLYLKHQSFLVLEIIANDCYKRGCFYFAARAFDLLYRINPIIENWNGKLGSCIGLFQQVIVGYEKHDRLKNILVLLTNTINKEVNRIIRIIQSWMHENLK